NRRTRLDQPRYVRLQTKIEKKEQNAELAHERNQRARLNETEIKNTDLRRMWADDHADDDQKRNIGESELGGQGNCEPNEHQRQPDFEDDVVHQLLRFAFNQQTLESIDGFAVAGDDQR